MSCRTNPSPIRFCTGDHGLAEPESQASTSQLRQVDRCQGKRKALARPSSAMAIAGHPPDQTAPGQTRGAPKAAHRGKLPPQLRQADRRQGTRKALAKPNGAKARVGHPSGQATPDQAAPGIQTEIASLNGDRRFQSQRSGTISSGPLKKLRVSCVHERDGKQVPCVRSLCSYARESRAC